jgi:hypothetical protein
VARPRKDITGQVFGRLKAIRSTEKKTRHGYIWLCECACGNSHEAAISQLTSETITSCGCSRRKEAE